MSNEISWKSLIGEKIKVPNLKGVGKVCSVEDAGVWFEFEVEFSVTSKPGTNFFFAPFTALHKAKFFKEKE